MKTIDNDSVPISTVKEMLNHIFERVSAADDLDDINELENIVSGYIEQFNPKESSSPEQIRDLEKELGTEGNHVNDTDTSVNDTNMSEQERELRNAILGGMKEGPDERW